MGVLIWGGRRKVDARTNTRQDDTIGLPPLPLALPLPVPLPLLLSLLLTPVAPTASDEDDDDGGCFGCSRCKNVEHTPRLVMPTVMCTVWGCLEAEEEMV